LKVNSNEVKKNNIEVDKRKEIKKEQIKKDSKVNEKVIEQNNKGKK
jgi:hypothetical protein